MLNHNVFENVVDAKRQILLVTKYWDADTTLKILSKAREIYPEVVFGVGENRIEVVKGKHLARENVHFIGNIQSQKIAEITIHCRYIHSLSSLKHAEKIEKQGRIVKAFIQIKLDGNKKVGIPGSELENFLYTCENFKYLGIIGISGMGSVDCSEKEKREEFRKLISLRDTYFSTGLISAGTSRDYSIALEEGIDVVRVGNSIVI